MAVTLHLFVSMAPNPALQPTLLAFGVAIPSRARVARTLGAAELDRWVARDVVHE